MNPLLVHCMVFRDSIHVGGKRLSDLRMFDALKYIRQLKRQKRCPMVLISSK